MTCKKTVSRDCRFNVLGFYELISKKEVNTLMDKDLKKDKVREARQAIEIDAWDYKI